MPAPHRIRLQGPWQVIGPDAAAESAPVDVQLPAGWAELFGASAGVARFFRSFHTPTNLSPEDQLLLRLPEGAGRVRSCLLNGTPIAATEQSPYVFDLSGQIEIWNRIELQIEFNPSNAPPKTGGICQPVLLEIYAVN